jgi:Tfp pilus assembly protein PilF
VLLARAHRALEDGNDAQAEALLHQAALGADAPLRAQTELARFLVGRGELGDARAVAKRAQGRAPHHVSSRVIGVLAAVMQDAREGTSTEPASNQRRRRATGPGAAGGRTRDDFTGRTAEEEEALKDLDDINERDGAVLALFLQALAVARGDGELAASLRTRITAIAGSAPALAARQIELSLLGGNTADAEELLAAVEGHGDEPTLALDRARLAALKLIPEGQLRKRVGGSRALAPTGLVLPFGELVFYPWAPDVPLVAHFDPTVVPEARLAAAMASGVSGPALERKLAAAVHVHQGETALARGDVATAASGLAQAREQDPGDIDVLLLAARLRLRQADRFAAREAIDAAMAAAPVDPHVLLVGARLHYDNEEFIPARKALRKLAALGFKSPQALALDAMLDARAGDVKSAARTLAEARAIGADDAAILHTTVLILREGRDMIEARVAASRLYDLDQLRSSDPILRAWQADAARRAGEKARARAVLDDLIVQRNLGDAHFFRAEIDGDAEAYVTAAELAPGTVIALEARKKVPAKKKPRRR